eukprot:JP446386.1.p2 GENE.JP446386.1~~JP446386.1.p2  ORF type:complete len:345 (+),score=163.13 JP446386.1:41-1075(+)
MAKLFCAGNPLLDISADVPQEFLDKYNVKVANAILADETHANLFEDIVKTFPDVQYIAGGATQNSARVAQWILGAPKSVAYTGCVGKDQFGEKLKAAAEKDGVNVQYMEVDDTPTGTCAVLVHGKERGLVANLAAANLYKFDHLQQESMQAIVSSAQFFYSAGFFLTVSPESAVSLGKHAAENNKVFCMNISAPFLVQVPPFKAAMMSCLPYMDFLFGNESEAAAFAESEGWESSLSVAEVAKKITTLGDKVNKQRPRYVVFTQGADKTIVACSDGSLTEYPVPAVPAEEIIDTNGAGDAFVGGFLAQLVLGKSIEEAVRCGHYASSVIIRRSGCTYPETHSFQ